VTFLEIKLVGCNRTLRAPRSEDRRRFYTLCNALGFRVSTVPPLVAGFIRREVRRALNEGRKPSVNSVRQRMLNSRYRRWV
jgi:hypothetical protein